MTFLDSKDRVCFLSCSLLFLTQQWSSGSRTTTRPVEQQQPMGGQDREHPGLMGNKLCPLLLSYFFGELNNMFTLSLWEMSGQYVLKVCELQTSPLLSFMAGWSPLCFRWIMKDLNNTGPNLSICCHLQDCLCARRPAKSTDSWSMQLSRQHSIGGKKVLWYCT